MAMMYLDHNATTPMDERVLEAMLPYLTGVTGNASSVHRYGRLVRAALDQARQQVAALVNAQASQIVFTSGGTEANNLALKGVVARHKVPGRIACSAIEHSSVIESAQALAKSGWPCDLILPDRNGRITPAAVAAQLHEDTVLVSVMSANNETGVIQDIPAIAQEVRSAGALLHTDAVQAAGKIALDFPASGAHLMSISSHKIYGPAGVGALVLDKLVELQPLLHGGGHEKGLRAGTENVAGIVGFGMAAELALTELDAHRRHMQGLRDELEDGLHALPGVVVFGEGTERLSNTVQFSVPGIDSETLLMQLDRHGIAVSSGSACSSNSHEPSHVLLAMGVDARMARSAIRVSFGKESSQQQVQEFCTVMQKLLQQLSADLAMCGTVDTATVAGR